MSVFVEIRIGELFAGDERYVITTNGVGSCVVVILHDSLARVGGMAHAVLPRPRGEEFPPILTKKDDAGKRFEKYVEPAIEALISEIEILGGAREHLVAKLVGGARMFALLEGDEHGIGWENTSMARDALARRGIPIETEVTGGTAGRNIRFDCSTGIVEVTTKV